MWVRFKWFKQLESIGHCSANFANIGSRTRGVRIMLLHNNLWQNVLSLYLCFGLVIWNSQEIFNWVISKSWILVAQVTTGAEKLVSVPVIDPIVLEIKISHLHYSFDNIMIEGNLVALNWHVTSAIYRVKVNVYISLRSAEAHSAQHRTLGGFMEMT